MNPVDWGPHAWATLHAVSFGYPNRPTEAQRAAAHDLLLAMGELLPCPTCRGHWKRLLDANPPTEEVFDDAASFSRYVVDRHNDVNRSLNKPVVSYDEAVRRQARRASARPPVAIVFLAVFACAIALPAISVACDAVSAVRRRRSAWD